VSATADTPRSIDVPYVEPVASGTRPFWSVMIPTRNRVDYLQLTLESVLEQAPGAADMEIEVVDNCSTLADVEAIVRRVGGSRVSFFRQPASVTMSENWTTCVRRARGEWVHVLHDDDVVMPGFYDRLKSGIESASGVGAAFCRHASIDEDGHWVRLSSIERRTPGVLTDWLERIAVEQRILTPAIVVRRAVYEHLGGFDRRLTFSVDWEMWKRIAVQYAFWYEPRCLAGYRMHAASDTARLLRSARDIADLRRCVEISRSYLPEAHADAWSRRALERYALHAILRARELVKRHDLRATAAQVREALRCSRSPRVLWSLTRLLRALVVSAPSAFVLLLGRVDRRRDGASVTG
jgi:glycosyltransferase involved in cell wall biosynthesis